MLLLIQDVAREDTQAPIRSLPKALARIQTQSQMTVIEVGARGEQESSNDCDMELRAPLVNLNRGAQPQRVAPQFDGHDPASLIAPVRGNGQTTVTLGHPFQPVRRRLVVAPACQAEEGTW